MRVLSFTAFTVGCSFRTKRIDCVVESVLPGNERVVGGNRSLDDALHA